MKDFITFVWKPWWARQKRLKKRRGGWREHLRLTIVFAKIHESYIVKLEENKFPR